MCYFVFLCASGVRSVILNHCLECTLACSVASNSMKLQHCSMEHVALQSQSLSHIIKSDSNKCGICVIQTGFSSCCCIHWFLYLTFYHKIKTLSKPVAHFCTVELVLCPSKPWKCSNRQHCLFRKYGKNHIYLRP